MKHTTQQEICTLHWFLQCDRSQGAWGSIIFQPSWEIREAAAYLISLLLFAPTAYNFGIRDERPVLQPPQTTPHGLEPPWSPAPSTPLYFLQLPGMFEHHYCFPWPVQVVEQMRPACRTEDGVHHEVGAYCPVLSPGKSTIKSTPKNTSREEKNMRHLGLEP
jgi:hypothetical protein